MDIKAVCLYVTVNTFAREVYSPCVLRMKRCGDLLRWEVQYSYSYESSEESDAYDVLRTIKNAFDLGKIFHTNFERERHSTYLKVTDKDFEKLFNCDFNAKEGRFSWK